MVAQTQVAALDHNVSYFFIFFEVHVSEDGNFMYI